MADMMNQLPPGYRYNQYTGMVERIPYTNPVDYSQFGSRPVAMIPGRYITNQSDIKANEVPMDGSVSFFPTQDYNFIYAKAWNADGKIHTEVYQRVVSNPETSDAGADSEIVQRLDRIEKMLSKPAIQRKKDVITND